MSERVKAYREQARLTQTQLARSAGVSTAYVQRLEAGDYQRPSYQYLAKIAAALHITMSELMPNGLVPDTTDTLPEWQHDQIRDYAPDAPIEKSKELLTRFNKLDPGLWDALLAIMSGLASDEPPRRTQHGT